jgi:hypothetical protein
MEYREAAATCADCGVALVAEPPPEARDEAEWVDLVTVFASGDPSQLLVAKSLLQAEGIPCSLHEPMGVGRAVSSPDLALGPVQLQVRPEDVERARELLEAKDLSFTGPEETAEPEG